jgi:D-glycero-alpha-D-manno-heptose 1-phosphate guanylyltransferase
MIRPEKLLDVDVLILCGGFGNRLRDVVKDKPKCLVPINGKPFIDILLDDYIEQGLNRFVLCVGHLHEKIIEYLKGRINCEIIYSIENNPLGTGGAIKKAIPFIESDNIVIANGDSICTVNYLRLMKYHCGKTSDFTMVLSEDHTRTDAGNVNINRDNRIVGFQEKNTKSRGYINSGIYILHKDCFKQFPNKDQFSLEYDYFPKLFSSVRCFGFPVDSALYDIGTPERLSIISRKFRI